MTTRQEGKDAPLWAGASERLAATVRAFPEAGFAVLDGGLFDDLPELLRRERLFARSLFLHHADVEVERAGPWLLPLAPIEGVLDRVLSLVDGKPAVVFWSCAGGETVLYKHLRTLNMARIPAWAAAGGTAPPEEGSDEHYEAVMFRHWDPRVLGALLPVLDAGQFRRFLGSAGEITFRAEEYGGLKRVVPDSNWPPAPGGMLTLRAAQIVALSERLQGVSRRQIEDYVRAVAPQEVALLSKVELQNILLRSEVIGRDLGLRSERAFGRWAYVMVRTRGRVLEQPGLRTYLTDGVVPPDDKVRLLLGTMAALEPHGARLI